MPKDKGKSSHNTGHKKRAKRSLAHKINSSRNVGAFVKSAGRVGRKPPRKADGGASINRRNKGPRSESPGRGKGKTDLTTSHKSTSGVKSRPRVSAVLEKLNEYGNMNLLELSQLVGKKSGTPAFQLPRARFMNSRNHEDASLKVASTVRVSDVLAATAKRIRLEASRQGAKQNSQLRRGAFQTVPFSVGGFVIPGKN